VINPGEGARLVEAPQRQRGVTATGISATLTTSDAGVTKSVAAASAYPDLAAGAGEQRHAVPCSPSVTASA
jgi:hypothetical protein